MDSATKKISMGVGALLLACICCGGSIRAYNEVWVLGEMLAARRVGVEPTLDGIETYIVESVEVGMLRDEVEQILGAIAPLDVRHGTLDEGSKAGWGPVACDEIDLKLTPLPGHRWEIIACYNSREELVVLKSSDPDFPPLALYAPVRE